MWIAILKNGSKTTQKENPDGFFSIKNSVEKLGYEYKGSVIWLPDDLIDYRYGGSASSDLSGGKTNVESYWIQGTLKTNFQKIRIRFPNSGNEVNVEVV
ncbi:MAG: hypothetical protein M0R32_03145 [Candidatus Cloacimonetes bacterium]|jgi:hypothetical protein|nr:hypothetical protein [Candidatus Cloacimonadota bacterium]